MNGKGSASTAAKRKPALKPRSATGGPGEVTVRLALRGAAKQRLKQKGKVKVRARITFAPSAKSGECIAVFSKCHSLTYAGDQTVKLKIRAKTKSRG